jgi:hypothetical protein
MSQARRVVSKDDDRIAHREGVLTRWDGMAGMRETVKIKDTKDGCGDDAGNMGEWCVLCFVPFSTAVGFLYTVRYLHEQLICSLFILFYTAETGSR